jgi:hypothetical protein
VTSFIFVWDPDAYPWAKAEYASAVRATAAGEKVADRWSLSSRRSGINSGDRAYLFRMRHDRGFLASALLTGEIEVGKHWDESGRQARYAKLVWDSVLPPRLRLSVERLSACAKDVAWQRLSSGIRVPQESEDILEKLWLGHVRRLRQTFLLQTSNFSHAGAVARNVGNTFEWERMGCAPAAGTCCEFIRNRFLQGFPRAYIG